MQRTWLLLYCAAILALSSCVAAQQHKVAMPRIANESLGEADTGQLILVFSREASDVVVAINGQLVVEQAKAKRIEISGIESGYANIAIAADGVERTSRVWIDSQQSKALPVGNPGSPQTTNPLVATALSVVAFLISRAATDYLF